MKTWRVSHGDEVKSGSLKSVVVGAPDEESALKLVCGGPSRDYPGISFFDTAPLPGFPADRSLVKIEEVP
ncbi:MAG: hypothetical protein IJI97_06605 [Clostridia bacterium]|nr:hypothetical protein [Clostridia bacterium]